MPTSSSRPSIKAKRVFSMTVALTLLLQFGFAQQQPQQPTQQGQNRPPMNGNPAGQNPKPGSTDEITKARQTLENNPLGTRKLRPIAFDRQEKRTVAVGTPLTFKLTVRDPGLTPNSTFTYSLEGAPSGAQIDSELGTFSWTPDLAGTYTFYVIATDHSEPPRIARTPLTILVTPELKPFGYEFFKSARALIDYRLAAVKATVPSSSSSSQPGTSSQSAANNLPIVMQLNGNTGDASNLSQFRSPNTTNATETSSQGNVAQTTASPTSSQTNDHNDQSGGQSQTGQSALHRNLTTSSTQTGSQIQQPQQQPARSISSSPTGYLANSPEVTPNADALRYFVGPFDMLGLNVFVPAPDRYQLGPGDLLTVRVWSPTLEATETDLKVDQRGQIALPMSGRRIVIRGQTLAQAENLLRHEIRVDVRNAQVSLSLKALRTMSITVLGDAYLPGNYQVPAVATLFNALYMFGGPSDNGSLRHIELRRSDGTKRSFDLYKFLISGDASQDVPLQPGDTIWIAPAGPKVTIRGEVLRPAIYEADRSDRLRNLIAFAGGPRATGVVQRVSLETVEPGVSRQLRDVDLRSTGSPESDPPVFDGDIATVFSVREQYSNAITVDGAVDQPGQYAASSGVTVADIIGKARGLLPEAYTSRADLFRRNPDRSETLVPIDLARALSRDPASNPVLRPFDRLVVYSVNDVQWMGIRQVTVKGSVQRPGTFYRPDNMRLIDLLLQAGGLTPDASTHEVFLQRTNPDGTAGPLVRLDLGRTLAGDAGSNVLLADQDMITVQSVTEAQFSPDNRVSILGAVQAPGPYTRSSNMHLSDLIKLAGGPLPNAADSVEVTNARVPMDAPRTRVSVKDVLAGSNDPALKDGDLVTLASRTDILLVPKRVIILGAVRQPGPYSVNGDSDRLSGLISRSGGLTANAFARGTQFFREPDLLRTSSQERLSPLVEKAFQIVSKEEYARELAKSAVDKAKFIQNASNGSPAVSLPNGLGGQTTPPVNLPSNLTDLSTVSPARPLTDDDLRPGGNINVNLSAALRKKGGNDDLVLEDGDIIVVPNKPTTVSVVGAVIVPSAVLFSEDKPINYYVNHAGGLQSDAARDHVLLIRADGSVEKPTSNTKVEVGDIIWVPTKVVAAKIASNPSVIDQITKAVLSGALVYALFRFIF